MEKFEELLTNNKQLLEKALKLDNDKWGLNQSYEDIFNNKINVKILSSNNYLILYEGRIEFTKLICEEAIKKEANVVFVINDDYLATNELIVRIANEAMKEENCKNVIKIYNNIDDNKIFEVSEEFDEVKFIGNRFDYRNIKNKLHCPCDFIEIEDEE